jgi:DNA-binding MarR family transcriptional regulator
LSLVNVLTTSICQDVDVSQVDLDTAVGYVLKRTTAALRTAMDAALRDHDLTVPQYSCLEQLAHTPGLTNAALARGTFVSRQAMHQLLGTLKSADLVQSDGAGRHEHFTLTETGAERLVGASAAVAGEDDESVEQAVHSLVMGVLVGLHELVEALETNPSVTAYGSFPAVGLEEEHAIGRREAVAEHALGLRELRVLDGAVELDLAGESP